jgi:iron(III) transport system substrate-binding protein
MLKKFISLVCLLALTLVAACTPYTPDTVANSPGDDELVGNLVIYSGRSEALLQPVLEAFRDIHPSVEILLKAGSNSELANALIEELANPQADLFITTEMFTAQSLAGMGVFQPYQPENIELIPPGFVGTDNLWVGITLRARVIMYNTDLVTDEELPVSIFDLTAPQWEGQVAVPNSTNGSMLAQIASMRQIVGDQATEMWLKGLLENDTTFFGGHTDIRKAVGAGEFQLGLVNHYYYYLQLEEGSPVGIIYPDQGEGEIGMITNATAAAVINGARNPAAALAFVDFLISQEGQQLFAGQNYEYPLRPGVAIRDEMDPLEGMLLSDISIARAALDIEGTFELIDNVRMP